VVRRVSCRYGKVLHSCGVDAADWQQAFSYRLANVAPNSIEELAHPDGVNSTSLTNCSVFKTGT